MGKKFFYFFLLSMLLIVPAYAATITWDSGGGTNTNWSTATNWSSNVEPGGADNAYINNGATALITSNETANYVCLAQNNGTSGHINITGGSLSVNSMDPGYYGVGSVTQTSGSVSINQWVTLGWGGGSSGTYNLSGGTVTHNATTEGYGITVGYQGTGVFNHTGGNLTLGNNLYVGIHTTGNSTYNLSNSGVLNTARMIVGDYGIGVVNQTGGNATISSRLYMGRYSGGTATYNLKAGTLSVASFEPNGGGTSTINIDGGTLTGAWTSLPVDNLNIGNSTSSSGSFSIDSGKTVQAATIKIGAGDNSTGNLSINGGTLSGNYISVASTTSSSGNVTMNSGSLSLTALDPGYWGTGTFNQSGGNVTISEWITVGWGLGSNGTYNLSGGTLNHTATTGDYGITVGYQGTGVFNHTGGTLNLGNRLGIGIHSNSNSTYNLSDAGVLSVKSVVLGDYGVGIFNQTGGNATISNLYIGRYGGSGSYNLQGGFLKADSIILGSGANFNFTGGTLSVKNYTGNMVVKNGATLAPGNSPGTTNFNGNITFESGSALDIEIGGLLQGTQHDWLDVSGGNVTFQAGSIIKLTPWDNYNPLIGDYFDIITWDSGFNLIGFHNILFQPWDNHFVLEVYGTSLRAIYTSGIPEPATMFTILCGLAIAAYRRFFIKLPFKKG